MPYRKILTGIISLTCLIGCSLAHANANSQRDAEAIGVLQAMSKYTASPDQLVITSSAFTDTRMDGGLMVSNPIELKVTVDRPGSMHISNFDGVEHKELFFDRGLLTVFNSQNKYYAQAKIPEDIEVAVEYALEEFGIEAPLMDLISRDVSGQLADSQDSIIYLANNSRVAGVPCHHIAIRGPEVDVQLWVEQGERPVPRKIMITSKWKGGSPRYSASLSWDTSPEIDRKTFQFIAPEGAVNIGFAAEVTAAQTQGGE